MTIRYLLVQAVGLVGTALFFLSFQCKSNRSLFRIQFLSYLFYTTHLLLLGAVTGAASYVINTLRSACLGSGRAFLRSRWICGILCLLQLAALIATWSGWISLLPIVANVAATIGGYTHNPRKVRLVAMLINSPLWIVYDVLVGSWAGILDELITEVSILISIRRFGWKNLDRTE